MPNPDTISAMTLICAGTVILLVAMSIGILFEAHRSRQIRRQREGDYLVYKVGKGERR